MAASYENATAGYAQKRILVSMDFRIDRFATLYIVNPLLRHSEHVLRIPILMYHSVAKEAETGIHAYYRTTTAPESFATQMSYLRENGYEATSLGHAISHLQDRVPCSQKLVVITFDDGYRDFYTEAFPILERHGFTATVFLPTAHIGSRALLFKGRLCLNWGEIRELHQSAVSFGSHTVTHPQLRELSPSAIQREIVISKKTIEQNLGCAVESFAYPFAFPETELVFKQKLRDLLSDAGYKYGVCTSIGMAHRGADPMFMKRLPMNSCDDLRLFGAKLVGAYDWCSMPQYLVKLAKQTFRLRAA